MQTLSEWSDGSKTSASRVTTRASLARFTGSQLRLTRKENPRRANPRSRAPALKRTRVAVATGTAGHIQTGVNDAGILDHENEAHDDPPRVDDWF